MVGSDGGIPPRFVGREEQLIWMERVFSAHDQWNTPFVVTGPPGSGKTAMIKEFLAVRQNKEKGLWISLRSNPTRTKSYDSH